MEENFTTEFDGEKQKRFTSRDFFLTYPRYECVLETVLGRLFTQFDEKLTYACAAIEKHKDGGHHLHMQIQFLNAFAATSTSFDAITGKHGNYGVTRDSESANLYCKKEGVFMEEGTFQIINKPKKSKKEKKKEENRQRTAAFNHLVLKNDLNDLVDKGQVSIFHYKQLHNAKELYNLNTKSEKLPLPESMETPWNFQLTITPADKKRHYWIYSYEPNKGKTTFLKSLDETYRCSWYNYMEIYQNIKADTELLLMDEYSIPHLKTTQLNMMCDGTYDYPAKGLPPVKLGRATIIICANKPINEVYTKTYEFVLARFNEFLI